MLDNIKQASRLALFAHMERVGHDSAMLSGELCINERYGDDGFEVRGTTEEQGSTYGQASYVLRVLGIIG